MHGSTQHVLRSYEKESTRPNLYQSKLSPLYLHHWLPAWLVLPAPQGFGSFVVPDLPSVIINIQGSSDALRDISKLHPQRTLTTGFHIRVRCTTLTDAGEEVVYMDCIEAGTGTGKITAINFLG